MNCFCVNGWTTQSPQTAYPGPFCSLQVASSNKVAESLKAIAEAQTLTLLLTICLPAVAGGIFVIVIVVYLLTAAKRRRRALRNKVIDFGRPRPLVHCVELDETGWASDQLPQQALDAGTEGAPTQHFLVSSEVGFDDGQAAAAMAASIRSAVDRRRADALQQRVNEMQNRIAKSVTTGVYEGGPMIELPPSLPVAGMLGSGPDLEPGYVRIPSERYSSPIYLSNHPPEQVLLNPSLPPPTTL